MQISFKQTLAKILAWIHEPYLHNSVLNTNTYYRAKRDDTGTEVSFGVGSGGINHGVWSDKLNQWLIYGGDKGGVCLSGVGYREVFVGDYTTRAQAYKGSANSDDSWLTGALKAIVVDYPNHSQVNFKGKMSPNSVGYFDIMVYDTSVVSGGMPRYAYGTWRKWQNTFWVVSVNNYTFSYTTVVA